MTRILQTLLVVTVMAVAVPAQAQYYSPASCGCEPVTTDYAPTTTYYAPTTA